MAALGMFCSTLAGILNFLLAAAQGGTRTISMDLSYIYYMLWLVGGLQGVSVVDCGVQGQDTVVGLGGDGLA